jgi:hypothetical protein
MQSSGKDNKVFYHPIPRDVHREDQDRDETDGEGKTEAGTKLVVDEMLHGLRSRRVPRSID